MFLFYTLLISFFCYKLIFSKKNVMGWFVLGITTIYNGFYIYTFHTHFLFSIMLFISMIIQKGWYRDLKQFPISKIIIFYLIGFACSAVFCEVGTFTENMLAWFKASVTSILLFPFCYYHFKKRQNKRLFIRFCLLGLSLMTIYALIEVVMGRNIVHEHAVTYFSHWKFDDAEALTTRINNELEYSGRLRVESLVCFSFDYGFYSGLLGLLSVLIYYQTKSVRNTLIVAFMGLIGCILSGSRTILLGAILLYSFLYAKVFNSRKIIEIGGAFVVISLILIPLIGSITNSLEMLADLIITGSGKNASGSSVELRIDQLMASLGLFSNNIIFGNGPSFLLKLNDYNLLHRLQGVESLIFSLLIKNGITGIVCTFVLFKTLYKQFDKGDRLINYLGKTTITFFLFFAVCTGVQGAWMLFIPMIMFFLSCKMYGTGINNIS